MRWNRGSAEGFLETNVRLVYCAVIVRLRAELVSCHSRFCRFGHLACLLGIEHVHEPILQLVNSQDHPADAGAEHFGRRLKRAFLDFHYVADFIHQETSEWNWGI